MAAASSASAPASAPRWLPTGAEAFRRMLPALARARESVRFEFYIYHDDEAGRLFRTALVAAAARGVRVQLLLDGFGAAGLSSDFWDEYTQRGGQVHIFNPLTWRLFALRNHRKLLLIDDTVAFIGGFNIADEYNGDGVTHGWRDLGAELHSPVALRQLAAAFDSMFSASQIRHRMLHRMRHPMHHVLGSGRSGPVLLSGPRLGRNPFRTNLLKDLKRAQQVEIISSYFLPSFTLRRALRQVVRRGGTVNLLLAGKSDVPLAQVAARARYGSLLRAGVKIWEFQPQILHSKLAIIDDTVFVGSSNLDTRSFGINYELMVRFAEPEFARTGRELFFSHCEHSKEITLAQWQETQTWLTRVRGAWAGFLLTKVDPWLAHTQLRAHS